MSKIKAAAEVAADTGRGGDGKGSSSSGQLVQQFPDSRTPDGIVRKGERWGRWQPGLLWAKAGGSQCPQ